MIALPFQAPPDYRNELGTVESDAALWFVFRGDRLLVEIDTERGIPMLPALPPSAGRAALRELTIGRLGERLCRVMEVSEAFVPPSGSRWEGLRGLFSAIEDAHFSIAGRALQILDWDRTHLYCGRCGAPTESGLTERVRTCPSCRLSAYPRIAPAVMAIVRDGDRILLARGERFAPGMFSALAGFVEPGEALEQCVVREVAEEVGIAVKNLRYFASQPWPFPHSLMIAFTAEYAGGEIRPQPGEIAEARWFEIFQLPKLPGKISIARGLIDHMVETIRAQQKP
jgi:NAD+ diphosphatase